MTSELGISSFDREQSIVPEREEDVEDMFAKVFRYSPNPAAIVSIRDGRYLAINDSFSETLGYPRKVVVGCTSDNLKIWYSDRDRDRAIQLVKKLSNFRNEALDCQTQSGEKRTILLSGKIIRFNQQACWLFVGNDITQLQETENVLKTREQYLRLVLDNIPQQVFWKDADLFFLGCNKNWAEAAGLEQTTDVIGKTDYDLLPSEEIAESFRAFDRKIVETDTPSLNMIATKVRPGPKGEPIWLNISKIPLHGLQGEVIGILGVLEDITERKQVEEKLKLTQFFLDRSRDYVLFVDSEARLFYVNEAACQILGYSKEELLNMTFHDVDPNFPASAWERQWEELRQKGSFTIESVHQTKDGQEISVELALNYLEYNGKEYNCVMVRDIRDRKRAEAALKQAKESADKANRAKSEFLAKMSHELRTPLNNILGFTQVMTGDAKLTPEQKEHLNIISRSGEHLLTLINDVLAMSKIEAGRVTLNTNRCDFHRLLNNLEEMLQLRANSKNLQLTFALTSDIPQYLHTDEGKLRQVLINLLGNAIKFTHQGSITLRVRKDNRPVASAPTPSPEKRSDRAQDAASLDVPVMNLLFEVEDTGPGISAQELDTLFDPFVQTETGHNSPGGTGLGLSISQQFVKLMGGQITVSSTPGQGTVFRFNIQTRLAKPLTKPAAQQPRKVVGMAPDQPKYRILVAEDHKVSRLLLVKLLKRVGFEVREAANGEDAVTCWENWHPHLIWMDMQMPVMDGYEATQTIKHKGSKTSPHRDNIQGRNLESTQTASADSLPVPSSPGPTLPQTVNFSQSASTTSNQTTIIALTASAFEEDRATILAAGCDDFVSKPFRTEVIFDKMNQYLGVRYLYEDSIKDVASSD